MPISKYTCGNVFPSGCVLYTGQLPTFVDVESFPCDARLDDIIEAINDQVETILTGIDLTAIEPNCFTFDPANVTVKEFVQEAIDFICDHETRLDEVEDDLLNLDISTKVINLDLDCLTPAAAPCEQGTNDYTLLSILLTFRSEICAIKDYLNL